MADTGAPADTSAVDKKDKKKKEKTEDGEKKPKRSSVKKQEPAMEEAAHDSLDMKQIEVQEPQYVEAGVGPEAEPQGQVEPQVTVTEPQQETGKDTQAESNTEETPPEESAEHLAEPPPPPRRRPSRRNFELEIDEERLNMLREAFVIFDFNQDGVICKDDLRKSRIAMGEDIHDIHDEDLEKMMSEAYEPLDFDAFVMLLGYRTIELDPEEILKEAMTFWDSEGTGLIPEEKFRFDLTHLGDKFTDKEVDMALEDAPLKVGFGFYKDIRMIDYSKFCHILCGLRKKTKDPSLEEYGLDVNP